MENRESFDRKTHSPVFLIAHMSLHLIFSLVIALLVGYIWHDFEVAIVAFALGFLLDIDHYLFDYWLSYFLLPDPGRFSVSKCLRGEYFRHCDKRFLFFHSYELLVLFLVVSLVLGKTTMGLAGGLSFFVHLFIDKATYRNTRGLYYFATFRAAKNFDLEELLVTQC